MYVCPQARVFKGTGRGCTKTLFMGARDGCSSFFVCGCARFLSWWAVIVCGWLEWVILVAGGLLRVITIDLSMDGRASQGGSKCRLVLPHTLRVSLCSGLPSWPFVNGGGGPSWPFVGACQLWWWVLMASGPSSLFVNGGVGRPWTFMGGCRHSSIVVVDPRSQSSMVMVGAHCVLWGLPEESVVVTCDIVFISCPTVLHSSHLRHCVEDNK